MMWVPEIKSRSSGRSSRLLTMESSFQPHLTFSHFFYRVLWDQRKDLRKTSSLGLSVPRSLTLGISSGWGKWVSLYSHLLQTKLLWWWMSELLIYEYIRISSKAFCTLFFLVESVIFGIHLGLLIFWSHVLGHLSSIGYVFHLVEWALYHTR